MLDWKSNFAEVYGANFSGVYGSRLIFPPVASDNCVTMSLTATAGFPRHLFPRDQRMNICDNILRSCIFLHGNKKTKDMRSIEFSSLNVLMRDKATKIELQNWFCERWLILAAIKTLFKIQHWVQVCSNLRRASKFKTWILHFSFSPPSPKRWLVNTDNSGPIHFCRRSSPVWNYILWSSSCKNIFSTYYSTSLRGLKQSQQDICLPNISKYIVSSGQQGTTSIKCQF